MQKINVGLIGVSGYTGMELVRLLAYHDMFNLNLVSSRSEEGKKLSAVYPFLQAHSYGELDITNPTTSEIAQKCDLVFLAVPHGVAMEMAKDLLNAGIKVVDLSADFRINSVEIFEKWYKSNHTAPELLKDAVYGLPELYSDNIIDAKLIANPGCYPTASILALYPALKHKLISTERIIIDAKSGTSGAGRKAVQNSLFCEVYDTFKPYGLTTHRHTPEIEQELSKVAGKDIIVSFNPHLIPINRGILATIYTSLVKDITEEEIRTLYLEAYKSSPIVRILDAGKFSETRYVKGTMFCDIAFIIDKRTNQLIITSAIDNLARGASGQAIANANLMSGLNVDFGLRHIPLML